MMGSGSRCLCTSRWEQQSILDPAEDANGMCDTALASTLSVLDGTDHAFLVHSLRILPLVQLAR